MDQEERLKSALADRYRIEREIGSGGMATVYLAQDLKHDRQVAVKVLDPDLAQTLGAERFLREIKTAANLTHPHILPVHDSGEADGLLYFVMPFVKGESLRTRLTKEKQLPVEDAIQIAREIAGALAYAHREGVIHRDIKPANIMLEEGHAVLADFGVAHAVAEVKDERLTRTGTSLGTPSYMSPEQASGEQDLDGRSDQYALGCVLHEMLAGQPPFTGAQAASVIRQHLTADPPDITLFRPTVPSGVAEVLSRALAKAPADRFATASEFSGVLAAQLHTPSGGTQTAARPGPRPGRVALSLAGAVLAILVLVVAFGMLRDGWGEATFPEDYVAVFPFENLTGDEGLDELGFLVSHWVTDGIRRTSEVRVVAADFAAQAWEGRAESGTALDAALDLEVGKAVTGVFSLRGDSLEFRAEIAQASNGELLHTVEALGTLEDPREGIDRLQERVTGAFGVLLSESTEKVWSPTPPTYDAFQSYMRGQELEVSSDWAGALLFYDEALRLDSTFFAAAVGVGWMSTAAGLREKRDSILTWARLHLAEMSPVEQLDFERFGAMAAGNWEEVLRAQRSRFRLDPASSAYDLANLTLLAGQPEEALNALKEVDLDAPFWRDYPYPMDRMVEANYITGRYEAALDAARHGKERFPEYPWFLGHEIMALAALDRLEEVGPLMEVLEGMAPDRGDTPGGVFLGLAERFARLGFPEEAFESAGRALKWFIARNPEGYRTSRARSLLLSDRPEEALGLMRERIEDAPESLVVRGQHGIALAQSGDRVGAEAVVAWLEEQGRPSFTESPSNWRAAILARLDRKAEATALLQEAIREGEIPWVSPTDWRFMHLWGYEPFESLAGPNG